MTLLYNIPGLMAYSAYNVSVRATNQYGVGYFSEEVTVRTEEGGEYVSHCILGIPRKPSNTTYLEFIIYDMYVLYYILYILYTNDTQNAI